MRFYGVPSENRVLEIVESIKNGEWVFEDTKEKVKETLSFEEAKAKLRQLVEEVKRWKEQLTTLTQGTVFIFVHEPSEPKAFKIYDTSSLGCSTSLTPPRWKVYLKELENAEGL
ncbi:MAG: hypothetical protein GXO18_00045 [Aquificae bacterium]|nr:hypothetical protein [Aquificota bacterium]